MHRIMLPLSTSITLLAICLWSSAAQAQATRTWVSGVGDDANPCSRTAPCKTFAGAISTAAGWIDALDPGGRHGDHYQASRSMAAAGVAGILAERRQRHYRFSRSKRHRYAALAHKRRRGDPEWWRPERYPLSVRRRTACRDCNILVHWRRINVATSEAVTRGAFSHQ